MIASAKHWIAFGGAVVSAVAGCRTGNSAAMTETRTAVRAAETAERARRHEEARAGFESAIAHARDRESIGYARARFGETLLSWGEYREGAVQLEASVAANSTDPAPWHNLGLARAKLGDPSGAAFALERARDLAPTDWRPRISLAQLRWTAATTCFRTPPPHDRCSALVVATQHEYRAMLTLTLPGSLRTAVQWALQQLDLPFAGLRPEVLGQGSHGS